MNTLKKTSNLLAVALISMLIMSCNSNSEDSKKDSASKDEATTLAMNGMNAEQEPITDEEVATFIDIYQDMMNIQQGVQQKAMNILQESGLSIEKYQQIMT